MAKVLREERACIYCGSLFTTEYEGNVYCSRSCCARGPSRQRADHQKRVASVIRGTKYKTSSGYVQFLCHWHPRSSSNGTVLEHHIVMERKINRLMVRGEEVHHKNGVRDDNRPENLELWVTSQPSGQRPEDLVSWAKEILERYE